MMAELKKLLSGKFVLLLVLCLMANAVVTYMTLPSLPATGGEVTAYVEQYRENPDAFLQKYRETEFPEEINPIYLDKELFCLMTVHDRMVYQKDYQKELKAVIFQAKVNLSEAEENTYESRYQRQVIERYEKLTHQNDEISYIRGWDVFLTENHSVLLSAVCMMLFAVMTVSVEKECRMQPLHRTCKKGGHILAMRKVGTLFLLCIGIVLLESGVSLLAIGIKIGFVGMHAPIQAVPYYALCPLPISVGIYAVLQFAVRIFSVFAVGILAAILAKWSDSPLVPLLAVPAILAICYFLTVDERFVRSTVRYGNLYAALAVTTVGKRYLAVPVFGHPVSFLPLAAGTLLLFCLLEIIGFLLLYGMRASVGKQRKTVVQSPKKAMRMTHPLYAECKKLGMQKWILLLAVAILAVKIIYTPQAASENKDDLYRRYLAPYEGEFTEEKSLQVLMTRMDIQSTIGRKDAMAAAYREGNITRDDYQRFMEQYWDAYVANLYFHQVERYNAYLTEKTAENREVYYVNDSGFRFLFAETPDILLMGLLFVISWWLFAYEENTGILPMTRATKNGRKHSFRVKIGFSLLMGFLFSTLFVVYDYVVAAQTLPLRLWNASAVSLMQFADLQSNVTVLQLYLISCVIKVASSMLFAVGCALIGLRMKKITASFLVTGALMTVPYLVRAHVKAFTFLDMTALLAPSCSIRFAGQSKILLLPLWQMLFFAGGIAIFAIILQKKYFREQ